MVKTEKVSSSAATRARLLEAAGEVFADKGFRAATIREIIQRAKANVAAVNYHFGDKERLYIAVLRYSHQCAGELFPTDPGTGSHANVKQRLHAFVRGLILRVLDKGRPAWHGKLMMQEVAEPTQALDGLVADFIRPQFGIISQLVSEISGLPISDRRVRLGARSVVGQVLFYRLAHPVLQRLHPDEPYERKDLEAIAHHIAEFSYAALKSLGKEPGEKKRKAGATS